MQDVAFIVGGFFAQIMRLNLEIAKAVGHALQALVGVALPNTKGNADEFVIAKFRAAASSALNFHRG